MNTILEVSIQAALFTMVGLLAIVLVKYFFKRSAMMRTVMFIDHAPKLKDLPVGSGIPSLVLFGAFVVLAQGWLVVPVMVIGVVLFNVKQEISRYDLDRRWELV